MPVSRAYVVKNWQDYLARATQAGECKLLWNSGSMIPRWVYEGSTGKTLPPDIYVCHTCDNPSCINPAHLWEGTQKDNMQDASRKGRLGTGRGKPRSWRYDRMVAKMLARKDNA